MLNIISIAGKFLDVAQRNLPHHNTHGANVMYFGLRELEHGTALIEHASALYALPNGADLADTPILRDVTHDFVMLFLDVHGTSSDKTIQASGQLEVSLLDKMRPDVVTHSAFVLVRCDAPQYGAQLVQRFDEMMYDSYYLHGLTASGERTSIWLLGIPKVLGVGKLQDDAHETGHPLAPAEPRFVNEGDLPRLVVVESTDG